MTDLYELTMAAGYFHNGRHRRRFSFELFTRRLPENRRYLVFAGLEHALSYLRDIHFSESQIDYLREVPALRKAMTHDFVEYLRDFTFRGDVWAMPEGSVAFQNEPLIRVTGTLLEAQLVETYLLSLVNTETLVASKASRITTAAQGRPVLEFGSRRTSPQEAVHTARAAFIAGFSATSNVEAGYRYDIPISGTAAHSWTMAHDTEREAFDAYVRVFPDKPILLVDTYDTLQGVKNAIEAAGEHLAGVRLDSGDLVELSRAARAILDDAGLHHAKIVGTGDLNELKIRDLLAAGAPIDLFGVGTELVRSADSPALGGVYKLVYDHEEDRPVAKLSQGKATLPGTHQVFRVMRNGEAVRDIIGTEPEFHVDADPLLVKWMEGGKIVRELPSLAAIRRTHQEQVAHLPESVRSLAPPTEAEAYPVAVSDGLEALRREVERHVTAETHLRG